MSGSSIASISIAVHLALFFLPLSPILMAPRRKRRAFTRKKFAPSFQPDSISPGSTPPLTLNLPRAQRPQAGGGGRVCRTVGRHRSFRSYNTNGRTGNRRAGRVLDRIDPEVKVSREAQGESGSPTGRAVRLGGNGKRDPKSGKAR